MQQKPADGRPPDLDPERGDLLPQLGDRQIGFFRNKRPYLVLMLGQGIALMAAEFSWLAVACCISPLHYQRKASNAAPPISTMTGTSHCLKVKHSSLSNSATNCCNLFVAETRLFGFKACEMFVCASCIRIPVVCTEPLGQRERQSGQRPFQAKRRMAMRGRSGPGAIVSRGLGYWFSSIFSELGARQACSPPRAGFCLLAAVF